MAYSSVFSPSSTPQTQSSLLLSVPKSYSQYYLSPMTSFFPTQATQRSLYQPLRHKRISKIEMNPKRFIGNVKAIRKSHDNMEVFSKEHLAVTLAYDVSELSRKFSQDRGAFTVVFSGGSPIKYLRKLVEPPYVDSIDWSKWHVLWVEEPVVPHTHLESNYKLAYDRFISKVPIPAPNVHAIDDTLPAEGAAEAYETTLKNLIESKVIASSPNGLPKFDLMLLDMGPDGHVGSLFSDHPLLQETKKWVTFLRDSPISPPERITFTLPVINSSSNIAMVVSGAGKANAVYSALEDDDKAYKLPVEMVAPDEGELKWYLENGAASKLFKQ